MTERLSLHTKEKKLPRHHGATERLTDIQIQRDLNKAVSKTQYFFFFLREESKVASWRTCSKSLLQ